MSAHLEELKKMLAEAPKRCVQIDDQPHIFIGCNDKAEKKIAWALSHGKTVTEGDTSVWVEWWPVRDNAKAGSGAYIWHKDNDQVRCEKILFTRNNKTNEVERKTLRHDWKDAILVL